MPWDFYRMTYREYLYTYYGYIRKFYLDYAKYRTVAYQVYLSQPWPKGKNPVPVDRYLHLPIDGKKYDTEKMESIRNFMLNKLKREKDGKRTESQN